MSVAHAFGGAKIFEYAIPAVTQTQGIDTSHWNNWTRPDAAWNMGARFVIPRMGSINNLTGECYTDFDIENTAQILVEYGKFATAVYFYARLNHDVYTQAQFIADFVAYLTEEYGLHIGFVAIDIETAGSAALLKVLCEETARRSGKRVDIYTNENTVRYLLTGDKSWMKDYNLWQADYTDPLNSLPYFLPAKMWQYSADRPPNMLGYEYGCDGSESVDLNWYFGDEAAMLEYFGMTVPEPEPEPVPPGGTFVRVIRNVAVRTRPYTSGNTPLRYRSAGDVVRVIDFVSPTPFDVWLRDEYGNYTAYIHDNVQYCQCIEP